MKRLRRSWFIAVLAVGVSLVRTARADGADPERLFGEATALVEQQRYADALPKFEEAQRLDPGIGTQFNIALCYEKLGKLGSAWRNFETVRDLARASGKKQREDAARSKLDALRPQISSFVVKSIDPGEVTLKIDGQVMSKAGWELWPLDPGEHTLEASASTKRPWSTHLPTPPDGVHREVVIPKLEIVEGKTITVTRETTNTRRTMAFVAGGVGVVGIAGAIVTGLMIVDAHGTAEDHCEPTNKCRDTTGDDAVSRGKTLVPINAIAVGVGAVGVGAGILLFLTSGPKTPRTAIAPMLSSEVRGVLATGRF